MPLSVPVAWAGTDDAFCDVQVPDPGPDEWDFDLALAEEEAFLEERLRH